MGNRKDRSRLSTPVTSLTLTGSGEVLARRQAGRVAEAALDGRLEALFLRTYSRLCQVAMGILSDRARAEDVVMDAFVEMQRAQDRLDWVTADAYVRKAVVNRALRVAQRRSQERPLVDAATRQRFLPGETAGGHDPAHLAVERDSVLQAVAGLPPRQRAAIVLHYFEDLPVAQVADAMGCRPGTVKRYLSQARESLHERMADLAERSA